MPGLPWPLPVQQERQGPAAEGPEDGIKTIMGLEYLSYEESERLCEFILFNLKRRRLTGNLNTPYKYRQGGRQEGGARLSSVVRSDRRGSNGHKHKKSGLNMRNNFFCIEDGRALCPSAQG